MAWKHRLSNINPIAMTADCGHCGVGVRITKTDRIRCWTGRQKGGTYGKYKLTYDDKVTLFGKISECPICLRMLDYESAHLDHDHKTGELRGFLCSDCNLGLGKLGDSVESVQRALSYLLEGNIEKQYNG